MIFTKFPLAIVGLSLRLPGDIDNEKELWSALVSEKDLITEIPDHRWDKRKYHNHREDEKGKSYTFSAGVLSKIDEFDNKFFGISPREATDMDPQHRMLLELTWKALEDGAQNPDNLKGSNCGVFVGISGNEYSYNAVNDTSPMGPYSMTGSTNSIASNRISYIFDLHGPSMSIDTACSSSLVALHQACSSIWSGESDMAVAAGSNMLLHPMPFVGFSKASMLSPDGRCKSFDDDGKGYVRSEGGIVLFIKPLLQAEQDGDPIHAVILNSGVNSDGRTNVLPLPNEKLQCRLLKKLYTELNIKPKDILYIEAHGTGTAVGDPIEVAALSRALAKKRKNEPLLVGSIKSNVGHLETASGLAGVLKGVLSLKQNQVPATIHQKELNKNIDFNEANVRVVNKLINLPDNPKGVVGVNSFGFGGTNAHVILKKYKARSVQAAKPTKRMKVLPPIVLSANDKINLQRTMSKYRQYLADNIDCYYDIAYTLFFSHKRHKNVLAVQPESIQEVDAILSRLSENQELDQVNYAYTDYIAQNQKVALVYSGNGSQWVGMGVKLYESSKQFKAIIDKVSALFSKLDSQLDLVSVLMASDNYFEYTEFAQPALFVVQVAITEILISKGLIVSAVIGHSVGEISAAWASGALSLQDAVKVIYVRSAAQGLTKGKGRMAAISISLVKAKELFKLLNLTRFIEVAGINGPNSLTVTGTLVKLEKLGAYCEMQGIFYSLLDLDYSFHSKQMNNIKTMVYEELSELEPKETRIPYISTVTGMLMNGSLLNAEYWWKNIRKPVKFHSGIRNLVQNNIKLFVDVGPHPIMKFYISECLQEEKVGGIVIHTLKRGVFDSLEIDRAFLKIIGADGQFNKEKLFPVEGRKMRLPAHLWNKSKFWIKKTIEDMDAHELKSEHFLLGWRTKKNELSWENHFDISNSGYIKDHVVGDAVVMPAAGFVEMVLAAQSLWKAEDILEIDNFEIKNPLILENDSSKYVRLNILSESGDFEIKSKTRLTDDEFILNVTGRMLPKSYTDELNQSITHFEGFNSDNFKALTKDQHYRLAQHVGLKYDNAFQAINSIKVTATTAVAELKLNNEMLNDLSRHILHPVILDMCFQSLIPVIYYQNQNNGMASQSAFLPVSVGNIKLSCKLLKQNVPVKIITCVTAQSNRSIQANFSLHDKEDRLLVTILGGRFKKAELVMAQKLPALHEFVPYLLKSYQQSNFIGKSISILDREFHQKGDSNILILLESLAGQYLYETIKTLFPYEGFSKDLILSKVALKYNSFCDWTISLLIELDFLIKDNNDYLWKEIEDPISSSAIWQLIFEEDSNYLPILVLLGKIASTLTEILQGNIELEEVILFEDNLYYQYQFKSYTCQFAQNYILQLIKLGLSNKKPQEQFKILEIGSGLFAETIISELNFQLGEYHLISTKDSFPQISADVNYAFLSRWKKEQNLFDRYADGEMNQFDLIIVNDIALNPDLFNNLDLMREHLKHSGALLLLNEYPTAFLHLLYGLNTDWWHFKVDQAAAPVALNDKQARLILQQNCFEPISIIHEYNDVNVGSYFIAAKVVSNQAWEGVANNAIEVSQDATLVLSESGDNVLGDHSVVKKDIILLSELSKNNYIFSNVASYSSIIIIFNGEEKTGLVSEYLTQTFSSLKKLLTSVKNGIQVKVFTFGGVLSNDVESVKLHYNPNHAAISGFFRVAMNEFPDIKFKLIDIQDKSLSYRLDEIISDSDNESEVVITPNAKYALRLLPARFKQITECKPVKLGFNQPGSFSYLQWQQADEQQLASDEVKIKPKFSGLNFRDVMYALGFVSDEAVEKGFLGATLGMETAGDIVEIGSAVKEFKPGDRVMGFASGSFGEIVQTKADAISHLPDSWTYADGATVPTTFLTAYYSFSHIIKIKPGDRVLIHGAAGGVGIAAIQLAQYFGADIYATAGSEEKREFLRLLGIKHIYDSRSYAYADQILEDTNGQGVDVVLNSLSGEAINANFRILRPFGKFIELGKRDFYENTKIGLRPYRNNISYFGVDVDQLMIECPDLTKQIFQQLMKLFLEGALRPLPYISFNANNIESAFKYMQQSKQIGKIVIDFSRGVSEKRKMVCCDRSSLNLSGKCEYLIAGGTAGFGFEVACFLIAKGARSLILISRSGKLNHKVEQRIQELKEGISDLHIEIKAVDIADRDDCESLFKGLKSDSRPVKGIINAAAIYDDYIIRQMPVESFKKVLKPKVDGSNYLDLYSRHLDLDFFILFSSVTTFFGNIGQANYVSANAYMESLVKSRIQSGLSGLYIAWGPISDAGYLTRNLSVKQTLEHTIGGEAISSKCALKILERLMLNKTQGVSVMDYNMESLLRIMPALDDNKYSLLEKKPQTNGNSGSLLNVLLEMDKQEALILIIDRIRIEVSEILGVSIDEIDITSSLPDIGIDSLMGAEFAIKIEKTFSVKIPALSLLQSASIKKLAETVLDKINGDNSKESVNSVLVAHGEKL